MILQTNRSSDSITVHDFIYDLEPDLYLTLFTDNPDLLVYMIATGYKVPHKEAPKKTRK